ncbi:MAG: aminotransferase class III-fold pyridoxal phosphate-dependent enzyme, partial [Pirellulales bacterium]
AMSVCDPINGLHSHFKGFLLEQLWQDVPGTEEDAQGFDDFLAEHIDEIAGVIIEPLVQGAGGMKFHDPVALSRIRHACDRHGLLLIADEIATGFGRTGSMFACDQADVVPDIICVGKALTAGTMGLAATVANDRVFDVFYSDEPLHALMHGPTFMANPLACAAANASLDLFESEPRLAQANTIEKTLNSRLEACRAFPGVIDVRCKGAIGVVQVDKLHNLNRLRNELVERGVWLRPFLNMVYMTPPLTISVEELQQLCDVTVEVIEDWSSWPRS